MKKYTLLFAIFFWGASFIFVKIGLEEVPPINLALFRSATALPILFIISGFRRIKKEFLLLGLMGITGYHLFQNLGMMSTGAAEASIIIASNPIFIAIFSRLILKERITIIEALGIALAFLGVFIIILREGMGKGSFIGNLLCLGSVFSWVGYSIYGKIKLRNSNANEITAYSTLFGTIFLLPIAIVLEGIVIPKSIMAWISIIALGIFCSGLAYLFWYKALEDMDVSKAGFYLFLIPVISSILAFFILGERLDFKFIIGAFLVIIGLILSSRRNF
ncbi:MAG: DMT family transporter [Candidatus Methanomethyliaceae archaeon]|nr:DMT family transporter [Candidatus Methanomethyliaceae archaeon]